MRRTDGPVREPSSRMRQVRWPSLSISPALAGTKFMGRLGMAMLATAWRASSSMVGVEVVLRAGWGICIYVYMYVCMKGREGTVCLCKRGNECGKLSIERARVSCAMRRADWVTLLAVAFRKREDRLCLLRENCTWCEKLQHRRFGRLGRAHESLQARQLGVEGRAVWYHCSFGRLRGTLERDWLACCCLTAEDKDVPVVVAKALHIVTL
jgi:hypothetical protein